MTNGLERLLASGQDPRWVAPLDCYGSTSAFVSGAIENQPQDQATPRHVASDLYLDRLSNLSWTHTCLLDIFEQQDRLDLHDCKGSKGQHERAIVRMQEFLHHYVLRVGDFGETDPQAAELAGTLATRESITLLCRKPAMWTGRPAFFLTANLLSGYSWARPDIYLRSEMCPEDASEFAATLPWTFQVLSPSMSDEQIAALVDNSADSDTQSTAFQTLEQTILAHLENRRT